MTQVWVPKLTRVCDVCGQRTVMNIDEASYHRQHGGKLVKIETVTEPTATELEAMGLNVRASVTKFDL